MTEKFGVFIAHHKNCRGKIRDVSPDTFVTIIYDFTHLKETGRGENLIYSLLLTIWYYDESDKYLTVVIKKYIYNTKK